MKANAEMAEHQSDPQRKKRQRSEKTKGLQCFALNCYTYRNRASTEEGISFHKFPDKTKHRELYNTWIINCHRVVEPSPASRLCSKHFTPDMINRTLDKPQLRENAVPTIFDVPEHLKYRRPKTRTSKTSLKALQEIRPSKDQHETLDAVEVVAMDHSYNLQEANLKQRLVQLQQENEELRRHIRNITMREKRFKNTVADLLQQLVEKEMISAQIESQLSAYNDIPCELFWKASDQYNEKQRRFALTLHRYSRKAYKYLRKTTNFCLPAPRTLQRWLEKTDTEPGFEEPLKEDVQEQSKAQ